MLTSAQTCTLVHFQPDVLGLWKVQMETVHIQSNLQECLRIP